MKNNENYNFFGDNIYLAKSVNIKTIFLSIFAFIDVVICFSSLLIFPLTLIDYSSAALGYFLFLTIGFGILMCIRVKSLIYILSAKSYSKYFMTVKEPFLTIKTIPEPRLRNRSCNCMVWKIQNEKLKFTRWCNKKGVFKKLYNWNSCRGS